VTRRVGAAYRISEKWHEKGENRSYSGGRDGRKISVIKGSIDILEKNAELERAHRARLLSSKGPKHQVLYDKQKLPCSEKRAWLKNRNLSQGNNQEVWKSAFFH